MMMKHTSLLLIAVFMTAGLMSSALVAVGQESTEGPTPAWIADAGPADVAAPVAAEPSLLDDAVEVAHTAKEFRTSGYDFGNLALFFALLAAVTHLLLTVVKRLMGLTSKGKKWLPWVALTLGVISGFFGAYTGDIATALIYGAGPPAAVLAQELGYGKLGQALLDGLKAIAGRRKP